MTRTLMGLALVGAAAGAAAGMLIRALLTDPTGMAEAMVAADVRLLIATMIEAWR